MSSKYFIIILIYSCQVGLAFCGNATVPLKVCEKHFSYRMTYTVNTTVDDDVFKDQDFFLSQLQSDVNFHRGCIEPIINIVVIRSLRHSKEEVDVYYNVTVSVKEENRTNYAALNLSTGEKIEICFKKLTEDILSPPSSDNFTLHFQLPNISSSEPRGLLDDFVDTNLDCHERILYCPSGSEEINKRCECSRGRYLNVNLSTCIECSEDTYQELTGMFNCMKCEPGQTTMKKKGSFNRTDCKPASTDKPVIKTTQLPQCETGEYLNATSKICRPCRANTYQDKLNSTSCKPCPNGQVTSGPGAKELASCRDGSSRDLTKLAIGLSVGFVVALLAAVVIVFFCRRKMNQEKRHREEFVRTFMEQVPPDISNDVEANPYSPPKAKTTENPHYIEENELSILGHLEDEVKSRNLEIPRDCLTVTRVRLGRGQFGEVRQVLVRKPNEPEILCAAKSTRGARAVDDDMIEELEIHLKLEDTHDNVVNLIGVCSSTGGPFYLIVEYCANGSLIEYLRKHYEASDYVNLEGLTLEWKLKRTLEICNGMKYLASNKIVHRDLAARNVLLDSNSIAKISDFGMAKDVYLKSYYKQQTEGCFPLRWMAIESIKTLQFDERTDVWSFGILVWEIFTHGMVPYYEIISDEKVALYILKDKKLKRPENCPKFLYGIMLKCWSYKGYNRPKFRELYDSLSQNIQGHQNHGMARRRLSRDVLRRLGEKKRSLKRKMSRKGSRHSIDSNGSRQPFHASLDRHSNDIELPQLDRHNNDTELKSKNAFFNPEAVEEKDVKANSEEESVLEENQNINTVDKCKAENLQRQICEKDGLEKDVTPNTSNEEQNLSPNASKENNSADNGEVGTNEGPEVHTNDLKSSEQEILQIETTPKGEPCLTTNLDHSSDESSNRIKDSLPEESLNQNNDKEDVTKGGQAVSLESVGSLDTNESEDSEKSADGNDFLNEILDTVNVSPNHYTDFLPPQTEDKTLDPAESSSC